MIKPVTAGAALFSQRSYLAEVTLDDFRRNYPLWGSPAGSLLRRIKCAITAFNAHFSPSDEWGKRGALDGLGFVAPPLVEPGRRRLQAPLPGLCQAGLKP